MFHLDDLFNEDPREFASDLQHVLGLAIGGFRRIRGESTEDRDARFEAYYSRLRVRLYTPGQRASDVAREIAELDEDARRAAAIILALRRSARRARPVEIREAGIPDALPPREASLVMTDAEQGGSIEITFAAIAAASSMLVDLPTIFVYVRAQVRRIPFRVTRVDRDRRPDDRPGTDDEETREYVRTYIEGDAEAIEARRIERRITIEHPGGYNIVIEEFEGAD